MDEPVWVPTIMARIIHREQLLEHGGAFGVRSLHAIDASMEHPKQRYHYDERIDLATLAASYAHGFATSHPFTDDNKRVGWAIARVFLLMNGYTVERTDEEKVEAMRSSAAGTLTESDFAAWFRSAMVPLPPHDAEAPREAL